MDYTVSQALAQQAVCTLTAQQLSLIAGGQLTLLTAEAAILPWVTAYSWQLGPGV